jgi:aspartate kinase
MKVFKFGGASVKDAAAVRNVGSILQRFSDEKLLVVISAMGKTTNSLEQLVSAWFDGKLELVDKELDTIKSFHNQIIKDLIGDDIQQHYHEVDNLFIELECMVETRPVNTDYDFLYDQIVGYGELLSTKIISIYLQTIGISNRWLDARNFINTSDDYRQAVVNWDATNEVITNLLKPLVNRQLVITQGFIGRTNHNNSTTLGREGSDYSASIFAYGLDAESVTIWKDVAGIMNADPKRMKDTTIMREISFNKAIELAYYGATIIHPKTIQPLLKKGIPLYVKSFINPDDEGSVVLAHESGTESDVPCYIFKDAQVLVQIASKDLSFIVESHLSKIFAILAESKVQISLMQNSAVSFSFCANYDARKFEGLIPALEAAFNTTVKYNLTLLSVYNYNPANKMEILNKGKVLLEQHAAHVAQFVIESN